MSNNTPVVKFPDKIQVESPKTDHAIHAMSDAFASLSEMLQESSKEMAGSLRMLRELPAIVTRLQENLADQFTNLFKHQLEAQILQRYANSQVSLRKVDSVRLAEDEKAGQLEPAIKRVDERYGQLLNNIAAECSARVKRLDSHAFDIMDLAYSKEIQEKFSFDSIPALEFLAGHAAESATARTEILDAALRDTVAAMRDLMADRYKFYGALAENAVSASLDAGVYRIPVMAVDVRDRTTGETSRRYLIVQEGEAIEIPGEVADILTKLANAAAAEATRTALRRDEQEAIAGAMAATGTVPESEVQRFVSSPVEMLSGTGATNEH